MPGCSKCRRSITGDGVTTSADSLLHQTRVDGWLLSCLRANPGQPAAGRAAPQSEADWEDLLEQAERHKITPLVYHRLRTFQPGLTLPPDALEKLRQGYLDNTARNMRLSRNLGQVLRVLRREGIPAIVLKGAHLAELVYRSPALRFMGDLDLLVRKADVQRVDTLLLEMGCTPTAPNRVVGDDINEFVYVMPKRDVSLEIHWSIISSLFPFDVDTEGLWERSRPATVSGVAAAVLCPEDLVLHLCLHAGCTHGYEPGLKVFCDLSEIMQHSGGDLDWELVQRRALSWGTGKCVYLTLTLARELLGVPLPAGVPEALKPDDFDERFVALARDQIFSRRSRTGQPLSMWPAVARFWGSAGLRTKALLFLKGFFLSREAMARLYPPPADSFRIYLYYVVRLRDLLRVYGRDAWRWLRRDAGMQAFAQEGKDLTTLKDWLTSPKI